MADTKVGVVSIGRNEGSRLHACIRSALRDTPLVVYVDSGSTDDSVRTANEMGASVVQLDVSTPFTAARARNAGFARLLELRPDIEFVQFVDGDCEVFDGCLTEAVAFLEAHAEYVAVHGQRRERFPDASPYNYLCELEWRVPEGDSRAFGGDVMLRANAFRESGGYREDFIAGEDPELSVRLRKSGWRLRALDRDMTLHDAAMFSFGQWWRRMRRGGYAYALGAEAHGAPPERHNVVNCLRAVFWSLVPPSCALLCSYVAGPLGFLALLVYPEQWCRLAVRYGGTQEQRAMQATADVLGKFAEFQGLTEWLVDRIRRRNRVLIEYKWSRRAFGGAGSIPRIR